MILVHDWFRRNSEYFDLAASTALVKCYTYTYSKQLQGSGVARILVPEVSGHNSCH